MTMLPASGLAFIAWQARPEVWLLIAALIGLGFYATRVIGPKVVPAGEPVVTRNQQRAFAAAVFLLWAAADWPIHDIAERYLYSVHMFQHLVITFFVPPLLLLATPTWLARLVILDGGAASKVLRKLARPVPAGLIFNALVAFTHWTSAVELSVESPAFHYLLHLAIFLSAMLMWTPIVAPMPELRISPPAQMIYLFLMSIIPTLPAAWLTFADNPVYAAYDTPDRLWGVSVVDDQQFAGFIMKVLGGFFLWGLIALKFFRWASREQASDMQQRRRPARPATDDVDVDLTFEEVQAAFEESGPPPREPA